MQSSYEKAARELTYEELKIQFYDEKRKSRKRVLLCVLALVLCFLLSLCFRTVYPGFIPKETAINLATLIHEGFSKLVGSSFSLEYADKTAELDYYAESLYRLVISAITLFSGMALGLAGAVYQQIYRNPIASPSTIGATAGVNLGNMIMVLAFSYSAVLMPLYRYLVCMCCTFMILLGVFFAGKYMGKKGRSYSVIEMLMIGSILSRMINSFNTYMMYNLGGSAAIAYQQLNLGIYQTFTWKGFGLFMAIMILGMGLMLKMRFRLNVLSMDPMESQAAGVRLWTEQLLALIIGTAIIAAACIQCGDVGLFALVIPHAVRYAVGSDFRKLAVYSTLFGGILFLIMRMISSMIFLGSEPIPVNFIVSIVMIPIFLVLLALQRRGFE